ncbi:hypothetical protein [Streptomyces sp. ok210]|uniref:hypothetical protein n=1 Tax=Streptomyces sp. ok210 TaxID=1761905 RepID=UPI0008F304B8|nr:hypothetical protein [Streptomyces sp. ok210]SFT31827.1 hypothetical protein SAMN04487982_12443 [Streptomyces sp. ok210]
MSRHQVEIGSDGLKHSLTIDGHDISRGATGLTLTMGCAGTLPQLEVDLQLIDVSTVGSIEAEVILGAGVQDVLVALGWTPPADG